MSLRVKTRTGRGRAKEKTPKLAKLACMILLIGPVNKPHLKAEGNTVFYICHLAMRVEYSHVDKNKILQRQSFYNE
jgi:hypothetical protein